MPIKIELQGRGAGSGTLIVAGVDAAAESVTLAIERNDGRYLGPAGAWQTTPHWHPQFSVLPGADGLAVEVGPDIVDGVIDAGGVPLRVLLRLDGREDAGVLRVRGTLVGSGAAAAVATPPARPAPAASTNEPEPQSEQAAADPPAPAKTPAEPEPAQAAKSSSPWLWLTLLLLLMLGGVGAAWYAGWFEAAVVEQEADPAAAVEPASGEGAGDGSADAAGQTASESGDEEPADDPNGETDEETLEHEGGQQSVQESEPEPEPEREEAPTLTGLPFARTVLAESPSAELIFAQAEEAEQANDCDAAVVLFDAAADASPEMAAALAARYDPATFTPGGCFEQPDEPYAIIYYSDAAKADITDAQTRLGELMVAREASGPTFERGLEWLRRAAEAGDEQARQRLAELEPNSDPDS